jgi:hypothetical protein
VPVYLHLVLRLHTSDMADCHYSLYLHPVLRLHTSDMVHYHCALYLHLLLHLYTADIADNHYARVLTSGSALYMHLTTAYATSRAVLHPAITIGTVQS